MFDLKFVINTQFLKKAIQDPEHFEKNISLLESNRPISPPVFQLETTNICNLKCVMCPRTTLMERPLGTMEVEKFKNILQQLKPQQQDIWESWETYVASLQVEHSPAALEDYFYYHICAKTLILHGFGEPILDKTLIEKIKVATAMDFPTYFSMNPVNISLEKIEKLMASGLGYLKFSLEGLDNATQLKYRGRIDDTIETTLSKIHSILKLKEEKGYKTVIILTKLNFIKDDPKAEEFMEYWKNYPVMAYVKNQHNRWLYEEDEATENTAEYMQRYCEFPWSSVSILYDGTVVPCPLEYEGKLAMGNIFDQSLIDIWNGPKYKAFREMHINGTFPEGHFCKTQCDYNQVYEFRPSGGGQT